MSFFERPASSILHPTDFSPTSERAFAHALAIAIANKARLTILHVSNQSKEATPWHEYPSVRKTLEKWGCLAPGSSQSDVTSKLGIDIEKSVIIDKNIVKSIVRYVEEDYFDLIVLGTDENRGLPFSLGNHVAVPVSRKTHLPTLFVPQDLEGCVSPSDGTVTLNRVLLPVDHQPNAQPALERISWTMEKVGGEGVKISLLHVGSEERFPPLVAADEQPLAWERLTRRGDPATEIVRAAKELEADIIVMVSAGQTGFWDAIRGSTAQQVLRKAPCPIFTMPAGI